MRASHDDSVVYASALNAAPGAEKIDGDGRLSRPASPPSSPLASLAAESTFQPTASCPGLHRPTDPITLPTELPKRVLLVSDSGQELVCGVTRKQNELKAALSKLGVECRIISSSDFWGVHLPHWNEIKVVLPTPAAYYRLASEIESFDPDCINFLTEGILGLMGTTHCKLRGRKFTTMQCSRYDLYIGDVVSQWLGRITRSYLDWFHSKSESCITPSPSMAERLRPSTPQVVGILNGCDTNSFAPNGKRCEEMENFARPIWLMVGRVCGEKNCPAVLDLAMDGSLKGTVVVVGDGPDAAAYQQKYSAKNGCVTPVEFLGWKKGEALEAVYRTADVFVFPSLTDTFGQVMVEAMASGLPVAAFPTIGPIDVVKDGVTGALNENLYQACQDALASKDVTACTEHARSFSWDAMAQRFLAVHPLKEPRTGSGVWIYVHIGELIPLVVLWALFVVWSW